MTLPRYLGLFRENDFDGKPGYSLKDREMYVDSWEAKIFSARIEEFLKDNLNGDKTVAVEELRVSITKEVHRRLKQRNQGQPPRPQVWRMT